MRRRDAPDAGGRLVCPSLLQAVCVCGRQFNSRQPSGLNKLAIELSGSVDAGFVLALPVHHRDLEPDCVGVSMRKGGRLMRGIKIPLQDFALKMQGGLMRKGGGVFAGHYSICMME